MWNDIYNSSFYIKYKNLIIFNKNIILASVIAGILNIIIVQYASILFHDNDLGLAVVSVVLDFAIYNSIFFVLYFLIDNRKMYFDASYNNRNKHSFRTDALKIITTLGVAEVAYLSTKFLSSYLFFTSVDIEPSQVSVITTVIAWILYVTVANLLIRKQNIF